MRIAVFFDGKNFYEGMRRFDATIEIDQERFTDWVVRAVGGETAEFAGAYYYTGHSADPAVGPVTRAQALGAFLDRLATLRGYFVRREPRVRRQTTCAVCHAAYEYTTEKRVDTRMVAELIQYAAVNAYDVAVLASGDEDFVPAVEAVDRLGKRVYVGHWPGQPVSRQLREACFGHVDFGLGLDDFLSQRRRRPETVLPTAADRPLPEAATPTEDTGPLHDVVLRELRNAEAQLPWISRWYFVNMWRGESLPSSAAERERIIDELIGLGHVREQMVTDPKGRPTIALRVSADAASGPGLPSEVADGNLRVTPDG